MTGAPEIKLNVLKKELGSIDLFIGCLSFESRCISAFDAIIDKNGPTTIFFYNKKVTSSLGGVLAQVDKPFVDKCQLKISDPLFSADEMLKVLRTNTIYDNIVIDITTFTREHLLILLKILHTNKTVWKSIRLIYTPAKKMSTDWLSRGTKEYRSVLGYPGDMSPTKKLHLIVMMGFEVERARCIIDSYEPDLISIGLGSKAESINPQLYSENKKFVEQIIGYYGDSVQQFSFSLRNPLETSKALDLHLSQYSNFNTVIAPMNTKVSTIGAGLYAIGRENVQLCYSEPSEYNAIQYSTSDDYCLVIPLF